MNKHFWVIIIFCLFGCNKTKRTENNSLCHMMHKEWAKDYAGHNGYVMEATALASCKKYILSDFVSARYYTLSQNDCRIIDSILVSKCENVSNKENKYFYQYIGFVNNDTLYAFANLSAYVINKVSTDQLNVLQVNPYKTLIETLPEDKSSNFYYIINMNTKQILKCIMVH